MLKLFSLVFVSFITFFGCINSSFVPRRTIPANQISSTSNAVVALLRPVEDNDDSENGSNFTFCTGVFINSYEVLTAAHCVSRYSYGDSIRVGTFRDFNETSGRFDNRHWTYFYIDKKDSKNDLALLSVQESERSILPRHTVMHISTEAPETGEQVYIVGHPAGLLWTYTVGTVSFSSRNGWGDEESGSYIRMYIQHQAPVYYGNSGGPIINMDGKLVGIVSEGVGGASHLGMGVHLSTILDFLGR